MGRADGRGVLMGCHEPLAGGVRAVHSIGAVWFGANRTCRRHFEMLQALLWMGWRAAKRGGTGGDAPRRSRHVGGRRDVGGTGGKGLRVTGCGGDRGASGVGFMVVKSTQRQGMRGDRSLMVSCGGVAIPGRQGSTGKSAVSM